MGLGNKLRLCPTGLGKQAATFPQGVWQANGRSIKIKKPTQTSSRANIKHNPRRVAKINIGLVTNGLGIGYKWGKIRKILTGGLILEIYWKNKM